jgi:N-acylneuraminate cytidylyltransferase
MKVDFHVDALIPARGGSKGIKNKNLQPIDGIPLVGRAVIAAKKCQIIRAVTVSSDCEQILHIGHKHGAKIHRRSQSSAADEASTEDALDDFIRSYGGADLPQYLVYIQCTSPFVSSDEVCAAIKLLDSQHHIDTVFSAKPFHGFVWRNFEDAPTSIGVNHNHLVQRKRRQDVEYEDLIEDGAFYVLRVSRYIQTRNRFGERPMAFKSQVFPYPEIDNPTDLEICRCLSNFAVD